GSRWAKDAPCRFATIGTFTRSAVEVRLNSRLAPLEGVCDQVARSASPLRAMQAPQGSVMRKTALIIFVLAATVTSALAAERPIRFWNLTRHTISEFYLAPAGTTNWGANQ